MPIAATAAPSQAANIQLGVQTALRNTGVALPGTVVSYDSASQTCTVRPGVHRLVPTIDDADDDAVEELPALQGVPVCWLVGRGVQVKASLQEGDSVLLVCLDRDASGWRRAGSPQAPDDARTHHWQSAVAIPGLVPATSPFPTPGDAAALAGPLADIISELRTVINAVAATAGVVTPPFTAPALVPAAIKADIGSTVLKLEG